jgi:predicted 3-demethylubiquinone-9 3-methyltransferase (glyoxalase superfamily)
MPRKISPMLWFDDQAEEAAKFYVSVFPNSEIVGVDRYGEGGMRPAGMVMLVSFRLAGQEFAALNGGPEFKFNEAISFVIDCESQAEVDAYWEKLTADGGEPGPCGWLKDKFGVSWQIVPTVLPRLLGGDEAEKAQRVMAVLMTMKKINIGELEAAYEGAG